MLEDKVHIAGRFQRSVRIDVEQNDLSALEGYVCPKSCADVLTAIAKNALETRQGAFTWTGPYGSGKSSLALVLSALLSSNADLRESATKAVGKQVAKKILAALPLKSKGWLSVPVIGRREAPAKVIAETLHNLGHIKNRRNKQWSDVGIVEALMELANENPISQSGLILFIDEMGKFLESAAQDGSDVYIFQLLAEAASRSNGKFIVIGILHQSFDEYANKLSRNMRDEWTKIQGRFINLAVNVAGEEQIELISRAIKKQQIPHNIVDISVLVSEEIQKKLPSASANLAEMLEKCWPLHPITACLLGPISRRRFGQNQRSIFGFLNSAEPQGFQDFIRHNDESALYEPDRLWDYLRLNLEPSILASSDGHRWAMAAEAIDRCEALGGNDLHIRLIKTIALIDIFKAASGIESTNELIFASAGIAKKKNVKDAIHQLEEWSLIKYRKFSGSYVIFAGSDFSIENALKDELGIVQNIDYAAIQDMANLQPILAKRHYHETGTFRWFDVDVVSLKQLIEHARSYEPAKGTIGKFVLAIPTDGETEEEAEKICRKAPRECPDWDIIIGFSKKSWKIIDLAHELSALTKIQESHPELPGDPVAQREVQARHSECQERVEEEIRRAFDNAIWYTKGKHKHFRRYAEINEMASSIASESYNKSPCLKNELLNRVKPSGSAIAAQNTLLKAMINNEGIPRLGIEGYPAEGGLFDSLLIATGLYAESKDGWRISAPTTNNDPCQILPLWEETAKFMKDKTDQTISIDSIYALWRDKPYGIKDGIMPMLLVAFILANREKVAFYREGVFQARFKDIDVEILTKNPTDIQLRWMNLSETSRSLLSSMAEIVRELDPTNSLSGLAPIDVARGLISIFDSMPPLTKRTNRLSKNAVRVREIFKRANDPNKFLFDDIPDAFGGNKSLDDGATLENVAGYISAGLKELTDSYPSMLRRLTDLMLAELQVPNDSPQALAELRARAENIRDIIADYRLKAFATRLMEFTGDRQDIEGLAGLAADKPPADWRDPDLDHVAVELADFSQKFIRLENFARVSGRSDKRHAMAVVVGVDGRPTPLHAEFEITESERAEIDYLISSFESAIGLEEGRKNHLVLAALAEISSRYMDTYTLADARDTTDENEGSDSMEPKGRLS